MNSRVTLLVSIVMLLLGSCAVNKEYDKALQSNSIRAYQEYQQKFPKSKYKEDVQKRLDKLLETEAWDQAYSEYTIESFEYYLEKFPNGLHINQAREFISRIDWNNKMNDAWKTAQFENTITSYSNFLKNYPESNFASEAKGRIAKIEEDKAWQFAKDQNTIAAYNEYIKKYPYGEYTWNAQSNIKTLEDEKYKPLWEAALKKNTIQGYKDFYSNYPKSFYAQLALNKIEQIEYEEWEKTTKKNTIQGYKDFIKKFPYNTNVTEAEKRIIDLEVDQIFKGEHGELPPLSKSGYSTYSSTSQVSIFNNTDYTLTIRYSGRESHKIVIPPKGHDNRTLQSGDYRITASVNAANVTNYAGSEYLSGGEYDSEYYIKTETYRSYQPYKY